MIANSNSININNTLSNLIINNCKLVYSILSKNAYTQASHNTITGVNYAGYLHIDGHYTIQNCDIITSIISSSDINISNSDIVYCNNCCDINI